ncbi:hypothetical protein [Streptomyces sp. NPDC051014]|uniref:hypothetical protein n=1 Tax=Streptomyces sp. NPDC051014 TaxID=3155751 RepID=UPI00340B0C1A
MRNEVSTGTDTAELAFRELDYAVRVVDPPYPAPSDAESEPHCFAARLIATELETWSNCWTAFRDCGESFEDWLVLNDHVDGNQFLLQLGNILLARANSSGDTQDAVYQQTLAMQGEFVASMQGTIAYFTETLLQIVAPYEVGAIPEFLDVEVAQEAEAGGALPMVGKTNVKQSERRNADRAVTLAAQVETRAIDGSIEHAEADLDSRQPNHAWNQACLMTAPEGELLTWIVYSRAANGRPKAMKLLLAAEAEAAPTADYSATDLENVASGTITVTRRGDNLSTDAVTVHIENETGSSARDTVIRFIRGQLKGIRCQDVVIV